MVFYFLAAPAEALEASRRGLYLWFTQLLPALLPFSILSYVVIASGLLSCGKKVKKSRISSFEWYVIFCGFLFGFPIGSKLTADLYKEGKLSYKNASILCCFTNNLSPVFVTTAVSSMLDLNVNFAVYLVIYGIPLCYGIVRLLFSKEQASVNTNTVSGFHLDMQTVDDGIMNGFETLIRICGYIMMFSIMSEVIKTLPFRNAGLNLFLVGCTEVTNGIACLAQFPCSDSTKYLSAVLFLSWNGISGLFQTASILKTTDLSIRQYLKNKLVLLLFQTSVSLFLFGNGFI